MVTVANRIQLSYPVVKSDNMTILIKISSWCYNAIVLYCIVVHLYRHGYLM